MLDYYEYDYEFDDKNVTSKNHDKHVISWIYKFYLHT